MNNDKHWGDLRIQFFPPPFPPLLCPLFFLLCWGLNQGLPHVVTELSFISTLPCCHIGTMFKVNVSRCNDIHTWRCHRETCSFVYPFFFKKKDERPLFSQMKHTEQEQCLLQFWGKRRHSHWWFSHVSPKGALNLERLHCVSQRSGDRERRVSSSDILHSTWSPGPCRSFRHSRSGSPMWSSSCGSPARRVQTLV